MKKILKKFIPRQIITIMRSIVAACKLLTEYAYWFRKDLCQSSLFINERSVLAYLMIKSHVLEKGITMPERRLGFGYNRVRQLIEKCTYAIQEYTENHIEIQSTLNDLEQYLLLHQKENFELPNDISDGISSLLKYKHYDTTVCFETTRNQYFSPTADFREFANQRHSVRWYSDEKIDNGTIINAIKLAQTAPSACNRQSTRVYVIESEEKKQQVLNLQNGNRGFGHRADKILLITSDMKFWEFKTRPSAYLDAGIFTQNLLYALHYEKICACTLNAHLTIKQRKNLKNIIGYSESEMPIVYIAIGKAPEHFMVAGSQRLNTEQILQFV